MHVDTRVCGLVSANFANMLQSVYGFFQLIINEGHLHLNLPERTWLPVALARLLLTISVGLFSTYLNLYYIISATRGGMRGP